MLVIGELLNGMFKAVGEAVRTKNKDVIQDLARRQVEAGADFLDVNTGPYSKSPKDDMKWLVEVIQDAVDAPLCLDSTKADVIEEGLKVAKKKAMINSTNADDSKMESILPLVKKYDTYVIGLTMDKKGVPNDRMARVELAAQIISKCMEYEIDLDGLYIDPVILPVNVAQSQQPEILESMREIQVVSDPPPKLVAGLSNVSQGTKFRSLVNRTFLVMAIANGLTAAICDPLDKELMDAMITAELILNRSIYCDSYIDAYKKR
ncbi:MAG: dihydropteroate synthase [Candidatus Omnitrophota bacterium]